MSSADRKRDHVRLKSFAREWVAEARGRVGGAFKTVSGHIKAAPAHAEKVNMPQFVKKVFGAHEGEGREEGGFQEGASEIQKTRDILQAAAGRIKAFSNRMSKTQAVDTPQVVEGISRAPEKSESEAEEGVSEAQDKTHITTSVEPTHITAVPARVGKVHIPHVETPQFVKRIFRAPKKEE
ncbi:hypothetical protein BD779DRAFT_1677647 [Infundibulicybe gibba]|nr:hypothetical protein BD779DRAFT_1677647 [Infundibulicybe gibba]